MGPNYIPGEKKDLAIKSVQRTVLCMGRKQEAVESGECARACACCWGVGWLRSVLGLAVGVWSLDLGGRLCV